MGSWDRGSVEVVYRALLEHGVKVGAVDDKGRTAFRFASANKIDETEIGGESLSEHGAKSMLLHNSQSTSSFKMY